MFESSHTGDSEGSEKRTELEQHRKILDANVRTLDNAMKQGTLHTVNFKISPRGDGMAQKIRMWLLVNHATGAIRRATIDAHEDTTPQQGEDCLLVSGELRQHFNAAHVLDMEETTLRDMTIPNGFSEIARRRVAESLSLWRESHSVYIDTSSK